jgi:hypothetical protein
MISGGAYLTSLLRYLSANLLLCCDLKCSDPTRRCEFFKDELEIENFMLALRPVSLEAYLVVMLGDFLRLSIPALPGK